MSRAKYGYKPLDENKVAKACVRNARVSYKNTHETGSTMRGRYVLDAMKYLDDVMRHKQCIPMHRYVASLEPRRQSSLAQTREGGQRRARPSSRSFSRTSRLLRRKRELTSTSSRLSTSR